MMSATRDVTTLENAAPIIKPKATSITLSRPRNSTQINHHSKERLRQRTCEILPEPSCAFCNALFALKKRFLDIIYDIVHSVVQGDCVRIQTL